MNEQTGSLDRLSSAEICTALCEVEGKPWADWKGKTLTTNQLPVCSSRLALSPTRPSVLGPRQPRGITAVSSTRRGYATSRTTATRGVRKGHR
jgi:Protein of unknown function (DUF3631)